MVLDSPASILQCSRHNVMLVTSAGGVYVWWVLNEALLLLERTNTENALDN